MTGSPERTELAPGLKASRIITGLWQVADMERGGKPLDRVPAARVLVDYAESGFDTFDMADHYGSAELISGEARRMLLQKNGGTDAKFLTKWCPEPHQTTPEAVRAGIAERCDRLGVETIDLLQLHWWSFEYPGYLDVMDTLMRLKAGRRCRAYRGDEFRHRSPLPAAAAGLRDRHQPGLLFAARPQGAGRSERPLPGARRPAAGLWDTGRRLHVGEMAWQTRAFGHRLEQDEIFQVHQHHRRLAGLPGPAFLPRRNRPAPRRVDRQCGDALDPGPAGRRRRGHRRSADPVGTPRLQHRRILVRAG